MSRRATHPTITIPASLHAAARAAAAASGVSLQRLAAEALIDKLHAMDRPVPAGSMPAQRGRPRKHPPE